MGRVPGISGLELGWPWPKGASASSKPAKPQFRLDSFEESGFRSLCNSAASSTIITFFKSTSTLSSHTQVDNHTLVLPKYASITQGGWMDTSSWFFELLWKEVKDCSLDDLYHAYFTRDPRPVYGENHALNKKNQPENSNETNKNSKDMSKENHGKQERDRRERHRFLQREADNCIPTYIFNWARKVLHLVKAEAKNASQRDATGDMPAGEDTSCKTRMSSSSEKVAGKDDQLTASVLTQHLASMVICRQHEHITDQHEQIVRQRDQIVRLEEKLMALSKFQVLQDDGRHSDRSFSSDYFVAKPAPAMTEWKGLKRSINELEKQDPVVSQQPMTSPHPMKRHRLLAELAHPNPRGVKDMLPPSPTPSHEGCATYFCTK